MDWVLQLARLVGAQEVSLDAVVVIVGTYGNQNENKNCYLNWYWTFSQG